MPSIHSLQGEGYWQYDSVKIIAGFCAVIPIQFLQIGNLGDALTRNHSIIQHKNMITRKVFLFLFKALLTVILLLSASIGLAAEARIIFPPDKSLVGRNEIRVVGLSSDEGGSVTLEVKGASGEQSFASSVSNGAFSQVVPLSAGINTISIGVGGSAVKQAVFLRTQSSGPAPKGFAPFYLHSKSELAGSCEQCHAQGQKNAKYTVVKQQGACISQGCHDTFGEKKFKHGPFKDGACLQCHNPHGSSYKKFLQKDREALCYTCHSEAEGMTNDAKVIHFPVKQGECTVCHDPHQSNMAYHLKGESIAGLCANCHSKSMVKYKVMHEPFESGDCNACHSPHVSQFKGLLYEEGTPLCLNCHKEREEEFTRKHVHEPVKKSCTLCHDQHGSESEAHLRTPRDKDGKYIKYEQPLKESCLGCHRKLNPDMAKQVEHSKVPHKPVAEGKCTACHTPHSTNFKKQLKTSMQETCFVCHKSLEKLIHESKFQHGPVRTDDCGQCHLVHGSDHKKLLRANFTENFTEDFAESYYELCFNCHNRKVYLDAKNIETGFRDGNKNLHFLHVNRKKDGRTCMTCHDIHASNQAKHIRTSVQYKKKFTITLTYTPSGSGGGCVVGCHNPKKYDRENPVGR